MEVNKDPVARLQQPSRPAPLAALPADLCGAAAPGGVRRVRRDGEAAAPKAAVEGGERRAEAEAGDRLGKQKASPNETESGP